MIKSLFSKKFLVNLLIGTLMIFGAIVGAYYYLYSYTRPQSVVKVPDVVGFDIIEAEGILKNVKLQPVVVDSVFLKGKRGGEIVQQEPFPNESVKENRKIYLTISRYSSPMVKLPNVMQTLEAGTARLLSYGFEIGDVTIKPGPEGSIMEVVHKGKKLKPGSKLPEGARLDLVVGGSGGSYMEIPALFGLDTTEAKLLLSMQNLNLGAFTFNGCASAEDSATATIYKQTPTPDPGSRIKEGSMIDVFLTADSTLIPPSNLDSIKQLITR